MFQISKNEFTPQNFFVGLSWILVLRRIGDSDEEVWMVRDGRVLVQRGSWTGAGDILEV